jgi:osmoprotectant transport system permease protein
MSSLHFTLPLGDIFSSFSGAFDFILHPRESQIGGNEVGGPGEVLDKMWVQVEVSLIALAAALVVALPLGIWLGHRGSGELLAVGLGNAGRAIPELVLIAFVAAFLGVGLANVTLALLILGIPPILTNSFVGIRQVDRDSVEAARGMGMTEWEVVWSVEIPLAIPTIMTGVRTAAVNIVATATIGSIAGLNTLGDFIIGRNVFGSDGVLAGAILVAGLAFAFELALGGLQKVLTPRGLELQREPVSA